MRFIKTFLTDDDGLSQKDFLLVMTAVTFFGLIIFATIEWSRGKDIAELLTLIDSMSNIAMTIFAGVYGTNMIKTYSQGKQQAMSYSQSQNDSQ